MQNESYVPCPMYGGLTELNAKKKHQNRGTFPELESHDLDSAMFVVDRLTLSRRERVLLDRLEREYTPAISRDVLEPLLTRSSPVSLRALDWAVVNWSKQHNVVCSSTIPGQMTNIHYAYRNTLSYWKRRLFDPFRRRSRIQVKIGSGVYDTTLGQANFALWTYQTGVLSYVLTHIDLIEADMNRVSKRHKKERADAAKRGVRRKRSELTKGHNVSCVAYPAPIRVTFD